MTSLQNDVILDIYIFYLSNKEELKDKTFNIHGWKMCWSLLQRSYEQAPSPNNAPLYQIFISKSEPFDKHFVLLMLVSLSRKSWCCDKASYANNIWAPYRNKEEL